MEAGSWECVLVCVCVCKKAAVLDSKVSSRAERRKVENLQTPVFQPSRPILAEHSPQLITGIVTPW